MSLPALVEAKVQTCPLYKESLLRTCQKHHGQLTLLCYADEVTGGNVLSAPRARKANIVYLSWLECPLLHLESQWLTASVCRSSDIAAMRGGMAALLTTLLTFVKDECDAGFPVAWAQDDVDLIRIKEIYLLADAEAIRSQWWTLLCSQTNVTLKDLQRYANLWTPVKGSPAASGPKPTRYFCERLWRKDTDFRGDADAAAATLSLVVAFCEEILWSQETLRPYTESLQCLQRLVGCVWACKVCPAKAHDLSRLQRQHFEAYKKAWTSEDMRPKWHYGLHLEAQTRRCGKLRDTFTLERKHKFFKKLTTGNCWSYPQRTCKKPTRLIGWTQLCWVPPQFNVSQVSATLVKQATAWSCKESSMSKINI
eukprot:s2160_g3.t1